MDSGQKEKLKKSLEHNRTSVKSIRGFLLDIGQWGEVRKHLMQAELNLLIAIDEIKNIGEKEEPREEKQDGKEKILSHTDKDE